MPRTLTKIILQSGIILLILAILLIYANFDPEEWGHLFPFCPIHKFTGLSCPACGNQRALHALLHGQVVTAIKYNFFIVFSLLFLAGYFLTKSFNPDSKLKNLFRNKTGAAIFISVYFIWFIIRNIFDL